MAQPNSRKTLKEYCLRELGHPVVEIDIEDSQMEDRIDDALQLYAIYHHEGQVRTYLKHVITQTDINNEYIPIPDTVISVERILPLNAERNSNASMFDIRYQLHLNDIFDLSYAGSLSHFVHTKQYIDLLQIVLHGYEQTEFSRHEDRLLLPSVNWSDIDVGDYIVVDCHRVIDPETYTEVYNDYWIKKYVTALFQKQWGMNLSKFEGVQLVGGITMNGQAILDRALADVQELELKLREEWERPLGFLIG